MAKSRKASTSSSSSKSRPVTCVARFNREFAPRGNQLTPASQASDLASTSRLLIAIIDLYHSAHDSAQVNAYLQILSKKHGQLRQAVQKMVERAMEIVQTSEGKDKLDLIETLRDISEGKVSMRIHHSSAPGADTSPSACACIRVVLTSRHLAQIYLEVPRARVTRILSQLKEQSGDINAASELMQELQVETFGSMERREKVDFILEQMRLLKEQEDFEKMAIVAKRINLKWLADEEHEVSPLCRPAAETVLPVECDP